jgi:hypothetical protein
VNVRYTRTCQWLRRKGNLKAATQISCVNELYQMLRAPLRALAIASGGAEAKSDGTKTRHPIRGGQWGSGDKSDMQGIARLSATNKYGGSVLLIGNGLPTNLGHVGYGEGRCVR